MNILVVEDNPGDADLIDAYLEEASVDARNVTFVETLEGARGDIDPSPDVVLLDLHLPDASHDETIEAIEDFSRSAAVIVMTGRPRSDLESRALSAGAAEFVAKGRLDGRLLGRRIDHAVQRYNMMSALRQRERALERYRIIVEHSTDAVRMKDRDSRFRLVNERYNELFERSDSEVLGRTTSEVYESDEAEAVKDREREVLDEQTVSVDEETFQTTDGTRRLLTTRIPYEVEGEVEGVISMSRDVTERREMHDELERRALYDDMTGLPNRSLFRERLRSIVEQFGNGGDGFGVAFLDVDDFKEVNDSLGHRAGDRLLQAVSDRLASVVRGDDMVARVGGDEFTVILHGIESRDDLEVVAERIRERFDPPIGFEETEVHVDLSIGFARPSDELVASSGFEEVLESVVRLADRAMYRAKEVPGTSWRVGEMKSGDGPSRRVQWENRIREGIERREFEPHFQPVVCLESGRLFGVEMLARWRHPDRGLVPPVEFIPLVEKSKLIDELTKLLAQRACAEVGAAAAEVLDDTELLINISAPQIERIDILEDLESMLIDGLPDSMEPTLEVTETALLQHEKEVGHLKEAGFRVFIDDFGTGHSSLSRLKEVPADGLKLDMEFIHGIGESEADAAVVETVNRLGERLDLDVIAEGVETEQQYDFLRKVGCGAAQGFWFARPAPLAEVLATYRRPG